ncbi:Precorrin-6A synthase [Streptomyces griseus]|nr:hypothetical protein SAMN04490359_0611 [Streptomyces griseus]SQA25751.1 Precorrin-6A synthase [Streptomyces griseus]
MRRVRRRAGKRGGFPPSCVLPLLRAPPPARSPPPACSLIPRGTPPTGRRRPVLRDLVRSTPHRVRSGSGEPGAAGSSLTGLRRAVLAEHASRPHRVVEAEDPWRDRAQGARGGSTEAVHDWRRATASVEPGGPPDPHHARTETGRDGGRRRRRHRRHAGRPRIVPAVRQRRHVDPVGRLSRRPGRDPDLRPAGRGRRGHQSDTRRGQGGARQDHGPAVDRRRRGLAPGGHCFPVLPASREPDVSGPPRPAVRSPAAGRVRVLPVPRRGG